jgi:hypothetical protein
MNSIPMKQNSAPYLRLLHARTRVYWEAKRLQIIQLLFTIMLPILGGLAGLAWEGLRPYVAAGALFITLCDVAWLDRVQRAKLRLAAKISEQFDCELYELDWNKFAAGKQADPETTEAAARSYQGGDEKLLNWYPPVVGRAPLHIARVICQRANLWYDSQLRRRFAKWLVVSATALLSLFVALGVGADVKLLDFVATVLTPAAPVLVWALRENFRQRDAADAIDTLKAEAESLFDAIKRGDCDDVCCSVKSREFQDAIYARRVANPLVFPFMYELYRDEMEKQMAAGAEEFMRGLGV